MQVERKGTGDAIRLRLALNQKSTEELQQILLRRDPSNTRKYSWDVKTRNAAAVVLRVRLGGQNRKAVQQEVAPVSASKFLTCFFLETLPLPDNIGSAEYRAVHELLTDLFDEDSNDFDAVAATLTELAEWVADVQKRLVEFRRTENRD